jgi:hypothetical protein
MREELSRLPLAAAVALLRARGICPDFPPDRYKPPQHLRDDDVLGDDRAELPAFEAKELGDLAESLGRHALALNLVASWLIEDHAGDIRPWRYELPDLADLYSDSERDPFRAMRAIEIALMRQIEQRGEWDNPADSFAGRQLALLFMLGLFDQPIERELVRVVFAEGGHPAPTEADLALSAEPLEALTREQEKALSKQEHARRDAIFEARARVAIRRLVAAVHQISEGEIDAALNALRRKGMVAKLDERVVARRAKIDCHPLVREYFGTRLGGAPGWESDRDTAQPLDIDVFRAAHGRLYDHYRFAGLPDAFRHERHAGQSRPCRGHQGNHRLRGRTSRPARGP